MKKYLVYAPDFLITVFPGVCHGKPARIGIKDLSDMKEDELIDYCRQQGWRLWDWLMMQWVV